MATACAPASRSRPSVAWTSAASGVVRAADSSAPTNPLPSVPMIPLFRPQASRHCAIQCVHVVLPFVPVTPMTESDCDGRP